jgi:hypothetical protein
MSIESTVIITGAVVWFAHGWYLNDRLERVHTKLDRVLEQFDGLRDYLYEIDPQFDDERASGQAFENDGAMFSGMDDMELLGQKKSAGKRTLNTPLVDHAEN